MENNLNKNNTLFNRIELTIYKYRKFYFLLIATILLLLPKIINSQYLLTVIIKIVIYICFAIGLNILTGYTGLVSLGHAGFVAIGAYSSSLLMVNFEINFFVSMLVGMIIAGIVGVLLGLPTLRVSGTYLSIITLGFGEIIKMLAMNLKSVTNGTLGVKNIPKPSIFGFEFTVANHGLYYLALTIVVILAFFCNMLIKSKVGRAFQAIRGDALASTTMGIHVPEYKMLAFAISAVICAVGGSLYSSLIGYIDPNTFNFDVSILILSIVILGGMGTLRGMIVGAVILVSFPELSRFLMEYRFVLYGSILVIMMRFRPQGLLGYKSTLPYYLTKYVQQNIGFKSNSTGIHDNGK